MLGFYYFIFLSKRVRFEPAGDVTLPAALTWSEGRHQIFAVEGDESGRWIFVSVTSSLTLAARGPQMTDSAPVYSYYW